MTAPWMVAASRANPVDLAIVAVVALVVAALLVIRSRRKSARREAAAGPPPPGQVRLVFHTYSGFLVVVVQRRYEVVLPAAQARDLLERLFRHNLIWGLFAYGFLVVPILSYFEYRTQSRRIAAAMQQGFPVNFGGRSR